MDLALEEEEGGANDFGASGVAAGLSREAVAGLVGSAGVVEGATMKPGSLPCTALPSPASLPCQPLQTGFTHSFLEHACIHSLFIHSFCHSFMHPSIYSLTHSFIHQFIHQFFFSCLFIQSFQPFFPPSYMQSNTFSPRVINMSCLRSCAQGLHATKVPLILLW